jgi:hypothetical protein
MGQESFGWWSRHFTVAETADDASKNAEAAVYHQ